MTSPTPILVTGGAGFIGSHTCLSLAKAGYEPIILDNFANSHPAVLDRMEAISGKTFRCIRGDVRDAALVEKSLQEHNIQGVVHFASLKAVGESVAQPLAYFDNMVCGAVSLLTAMRAQNVKTLVFSSSATVYGDPKSVPIREDFPRSATSPYGRGKLFIEDMLADLCAAEPSWRVARLRYFNPVGAHESGQMGEDPQGLPNNLMPFIAQVAVGKRAHLNVFGNDYPTRDGTGVRDYIHVCDIADGHVAALRHLSKQTGVLTLNLGTGQGASVLELVAAFENASGRNVPCQFAPRRPGDVAECFADPHLAHTLLGWRAERSLSSMCQDAWRWQAGNPNGYSG